MSTLLRPLRRLVRPPLAPRQVPTSGFDLIGNSYMIEEETLDTYEPESYYPARLGQVLNAKYQIVAKLGYGSYSTVWLGHDLIDRQHVALKIGTREALEQEILALKYLRSVKTTHRGSHLIRQLVDNFEITDQYGQFQVMVHPPLGVSLGQYRDLTPDKSLPARMVRSCLSNVLRALEFLHSEAKVIHADLQEKNLLLSLKDHCVETELNRFAEDEVNSPSPRKIKCDRVTHVTRPIYLRHATSGFQNAVLCDFGEARFGDFDRMAPIQPFQYRAPEVIFGIPYDAKVDMWNLGCLLWDLLGFGNLFESSSEDGSLRSTTIYLAHVVALLGPPPKDLLERAQTENPWRWFDKDGNWIKADKVPIPQLRLEDSVKNLNDEERPLFLDFARQLLKWKPEERGSASDMLGHPWLAIKGR